MFEIRPFAGLGHADHGWLNARHHFSFANYHDPNRMGWGRIRVWNDDAIAAQSGFPPHSHQDMEIITYVRSGAISHKDSLGNAGRTKAGDVQVMSAGTGIQHSEYNLEDAETQIFQIWVLPDRAGEQPSWGARAFPKGDRAGRWVTLAAGGVTPAVDANVLPADSDALPLRAQARVLGATVKAGETLDYVLQQGRHAYLVAATGRYSVNGAAAQARDGVAMAATDADVRFSFAAAEDSELVMVEAA
jgi:quercetin 2,3-dioxygenase